MKPYCKRLIEVDLPIQRISAHARRDKDMRRGHVPLLSIWPATRPPTACRAVLCAALWPDPADELCPPAFRQAAALATCSCSDLSLMSALCERGLNMFARLCLQAHRVQHGFSVTRA